MGHGERNNPFLAWPPVPGDRSRLNLYDQFGRLIQPGDGMILATPEQIVWVVRDVKPLLQHKGPESVCQITLSALYAAPFQGGLPLAGLIKVLDVAETQRRQQEQQAAPPPPAPIVVSES